MLTGLEVSLRDGLPELDGKRAGLITNHTGVDRQLRDTIDLLHRSDRWNLTALFGPEHGVRGEAQAGDHVGGYVDQRTGLPVHSLYGETRSPTTAMLGGLDALVFDIQDPGIRFTTYLSTMINAQEAAAAASLAFVVLDRPNPLTGDRVEGGLLEPAFQSFVGGHPLPVRHGLTLGELARLVAAERGWPDPVVVPMAGWRRSWWFDETDLPWVLPSPNLPTLDALTLYPGTCLLEGTNLSEGRGTTRPFEIIGAPWLDPFALAAELEQRELPGVGFRPTWFTPMFSKHAGTRCGGVQIHLRDRDALRPVTLGLHVLEVTRRLAPDAFAWARGTTGRHFIDLLLGGAGPRGGLEAGEGVAQVTTDWRRDEQAFEQRRRPYLLYAEG